MIDPKPNMCINNLRLLKGLQFMNLKPTFLALVLLATGCVEKPVDNLEHILKEEHEFNLALSKEYQALAQKKSRLYSQAIDASNFNIKGINAGEDKEVLPEDPNNWDILKSAAPEVFEGRERLLFVLDRGGRYIEPQLSAQTQVFFDCMIKEIEEHQGSEERMICKKGFFDHLSQLEITVFKTAPVFNIIFKDKSTKIDDKGRLIIKDVASRVKKFRDRRIMLVGHTDTTAQREFDPNLAFKRSQAVKQALLRAGVSEKSIKIVVSRGELKVSMFTDQPYSHAVSIYLF